jgi:phosphatidylinositol phospholipase C delta
MNKNIIDPFVQVSVHVPDWVKPGSSSNGSNSSQGTSNANGNESRKKLADPELLVVASPVEAEPNIGSTTSNNGNGNGGETSDPQLAHTQPARVISNKTSVVKNNGFNPVWEESLSITFHVVGEMKDLVFVRFTIRDEGDDDESRPIAVYCSSLGSLRQGTCEMSSNLFGV